MKLDLHVISGFDAYSFLNQLLHGGRIDMIYTGKKMFLVKIDNVRVGVQTNDKNEIIIKGFPQ